MFSEKRFGKKIERKETEATKKEKNIEEMKKLGLSEKEINDILRKYPDFIYYDLKQKGEEFEKELDISKEELRERIKKYPPLAGRSPKRIRENFEKELGISKEELRRVIEKFPRLVGYNIKRIRENFEKELGISKEELRRVIEKFPRLVGYNIKDNLKPKLELLGKMGVDKEKKIEELIIIAPINKEICQLIFDTALELKIKIESGRDIKNIYERLNHYFKKEKGINMGKFLKKIQPEEKERTIKEILKDKLEKK